jgi:hypothetical protein
VSGGRFDKLKGYGSGRKGKSGQGKWLRTDTGSERMKEKETWSLSSGDLLTSLVSSHGTCTIKE